MLCCVGLVGGLVVGQSLGGPWIIAAPAAGFAIGLAADMKFMKGHHGQMGQPPAVRDPGEPDSVRGVEPVGSKVQHQGQRFG